MTIESLSAIRSSMAVDSLRNMPGTNFTPRAYINFGPRLGSMDLDGTRNFNANARAQFDESVSKLMLKAGGNFYQNTYTLNGVKSLNDSFQSLGKFVDSYA